jgi:hypothetical protein
MAEVRDDTARVAELTQLLAAKGYRIRGREGAMPKGPPRWCLRELAGRLTELSGAGPAATLSFAFAVVLDAQRLREPTAWITSAHQVFYPPDVARGGIDLRTLIVVRVPGGADVSQAADRLLRSGALGLVVLDLDGEERRQPKPLHARLAGLARRYGTAVLCLTSKSEESPSLGPMVSLRCTSARGPADGKGNVHCTLLAIKDRLRGHTWSVTEVFRAPHGLC